MEQKSHLRTSTKIIFGVNWDEGTLNEIVIKINLFQNMGVAGKEKGGLQAEKKKEKSVF